MSAKVEKRKVSKLKKKEEVEAMNPEVKPSKEEYAIGKWMRANVHKKKTKFLSHSVEYFTSSKAIDALLTSQWSKPAKQGEEPLFTTRDSVVQYLDLMLRHKFFHRAKKIPVSDHELKARAKRKEKKKDKEETEKEKKDKSEAEEEKKIEEAESSHADEKKDKEKKGKRKIRLDMHLEQEFVDGNEAYVWIYDPIPYYYWLAGGAVVLAVVALCLFPLWPPIVRKGVYYLSVAAAGFLIFILGLAILRVVTFCVLWVVTLGNHHLWLFPNLTEDVGFFASFWPLWKYEFKGKEKKKGKKDKEKLSDDENDNDKEDGSSKEESDKEDANVGDGENKSETGSELSQGSNAAKDFEMVEAEEIETKESTQAN